MQTQDREHIHQLLAQKKLKATPQRMVILAALAGRQDHPTAEVLYTAVHAQLPGLSLGTVYSTLETLVLHGLAKRVPVAAGAMRYDACTHSHHHIYCENTAEIMDFHDPELEGLIRSHLEKKKIRNLDIQSFCLQINGTKPAPNQDIFYS